MNYIILTALLIVLSDDSSSLLQEKNCTGWTNTSEHRYLYIRICEYVSGGSGTYEFKNESNQDVRFSFKIYHNNGKITSGSTKVKSGEEHRASCFTCATKNGGGTDSYEIYKVCYESDDCFW